MAEARSQLPTEPADASPAAAPVQVAPEGWRLPRWLVPAAAGSAAVFVAIVIGLVVWNITLQGRIDDEETSDVRRDLIETLAAGNTVVQLAGTDDAPLATGSLVQVPEDGKSYLVVGSLDRLPSDEQYHVWRIDGEKPVRVGVFDSSEEGTALVVLPADFAGADAIGVSIEARGSVADTPLGAIVLLGGF